MHFGMVPTALAGIFLRVSHNKLQYLGEVSLSFDVHYDSISPARIRVELSDVIYNSLHNPRTL